MTMHADRDHSEPYWPPAATREPRVRFPLDDGDTGVSLLPVAPAGTLLRCPVCPAALADTRGGRLDHCDDGTHHYVPAQPADERTDGNRRGPDGYRCCKHCIEDRIHDVETDGHDVPCQTCDDPGAMLRELASRLERELTVERAKVARVETLILCSHVGCSCGGDRASVTTAEIRDALAQPEAAP